MWIHLKDVCILQVTSAGTSLLWICLNGEFTFAMQWTHHHCVGEEAAYSNPKVNVCVEEGTR